MKTSGARVATLAVLALSAPVWLVQADGLLPAAQPATRYESMAARSPFTAPTVAMPTPTPPPAAPGPHWWDQMTVTSLMEAGGVSFASVTDNASGKHYLLEINKPDGDSRLTLTGVRWNERGDQSTVVVCRDGETAPPLRFNPAASASAAPSSVSPPSMNDAMQSKAAAASILPPGGTPQPSTGNSRRGTVFIGPGQSGTPPVPGQPPIERKIRPLGGAGLPGR